MTRTKLAFLFAFSFASACSSPPKATQKTAEEATAPADDAGERETRPIPASGILAEGQGEHGTVRVEQRGDLRLLLIDDKVQAAVPWGPRGARETAPDPLVELLLRMRPKAKSALVIGLGSGKTAGDLLAAGLDVTAVEIEPLVIEYAREYFGYEGKAVAKDGLAFLKETGDEFDLVVMDAFVGAEPPAGLVGAEGIRLLRERTDEDGATALRMLGRPSDPIVQRIYSGMRNFSARTYEHLFGSGVGGEQQNLYFVVSEQPLNLLDTEPLALWPLAPSAVTPPSAGGGEGEGEGPTVRASREIRLVGYLHRLPKDGSLALDLPHWEMGAVRYLLTGKAAEPLAEALPKEAVFPTSGDISSDGDLSKTLRGLLGGGGVKRSEVRFSPVAAAVSGRAKLVSVIHPDAASNLPESMRGDAVTDDRLPWGGNLYELEVEEVHWRLDRKGWLGLKKSLRPILKRAASKMRAGELKGAARSLEAYVEKIEGAVPGGAGLLPPARVAGAFLEDVRCVEKWREEQSSAYATANACDWLHRVGPAKGDAVGGLETLTAALRSCSMRHYEETTREAKGVSASDAAGRLLYLLDPINVSMSAREERRAAKKRAALKKKFPSAMRFSVPPYAPMLTGCKE